MKAVSKAKTISLSIKVKTIIFSLNSKIICRPKDVQHELENNKFFSIFCVPTHDTTRQSVYFFHNSAIRSRKPGTTDALVKKEEKETLKPIIGGRYYYLIKRAFLFCSALTLDSKGSIINESVQYRDRVYFHFFRFDSQQYHFGRYWYIITL